MKLIKILLIPIVLISVAMTPPGDEASELIRRKIENANLKGLVALEQDLTCKTTLSQFYLNRSFEPSWNVETSKKLIAEIEASKNEGLTPNDYHLEKLKEASSQKTKTSFFEAEYDLMLSDAFLLYVNHLLSGKVNPQTIDAEWHVTRREGNPVELLEFAISSGNITEAIQKATPKHLVYKELKDALVEYRNIKVSGWEKINEGVTLKKGMEDERLVVIRERLFILGDLKVKNTSFPNLYDDSLVAAVIKFQARHGLDDDGEIGKQSINALNVSIEDRILQIEANMERWRWLPQEFGYYYIKVNIANFNLDVIKDKQIIRTQKIIAGKPYRKTPVFSSQMQYLVLNPTWTVPPSILYNDVIPAAQKDPSYLTKKKLSVFDKNGNPVNINEVDWNSKEVRSYTYRQPPGPENALGAVKFMFPNTFSVYLHDTPSKELFEKSERAFSSGCIRVNEPLELAEFLLNNPENYSLDKIKKVVATKETKTIQLKEKPFIHILYWTAWVDANSNINFRKDIYDRDKPLLTQLKEKPPH